jgi:hypothetical protein
MKIQLETTLLQRNVPKEQPGRVFGARSTLLTGGSPLGLAVGGVMLAFVPSNSVIAFSAITCILVGLVGLLSQLFRLWKQRCHELIALPFFTGMFIFEKQTTYN